MPVGCNYDERELRRSILGPPVPIVLPGNQHTQVRTEFFDMTTDSCERQAYPFASRCGIWSEPASCPGEPRPAPHIAMRLFLRQCSQRSAFRTITIWMPWRHRERGSRQAEHLAKLGMSRAPLRVGSAPS
jgi:hypothetical protein